MTEAHEWLTTREALALLSVSRTRLWALTREGRLTAHQRAADRRARYYRREDVERLADEFRPVARRGEIGNQEG